MKKLILFLLLTISSLCHSQQGPPTNFVQPIAPVGQQNGAWTFFNFDTNGNLQSLSNPLCLQTPLFLNYSTSGSGNTQIVPLTTGKKVRICSVVFAAAAGTAFKLTYGTGVNCGSGTTDLIGTLPNTTVSFTYVGNPYIAPVSQAVCANLGANATGSVTVTYDYF